MSHPLLRSGQWSQTTTGITHPAARLIRHSPDGLRRSAKIVGAIKRKARRHSLPENSTLSLKSAVPLADKPRVLIVCNRTVRSVVNDKCVRGVPNSSIEKRMHAFRIAWWRSGWMYWTSSI